MPPPAAGSPAPESRGAYHSAEIEFVFGMLDSKKLPWRPEDYELSEQMGSYWTNFAKRGNPNAEGLPVWPPFKAGTDEIVRFTSNGPVAARDTRVSLCDLYKLNLETQLALNK